MTKNHKIQMEQINKKLSLCIELFNTVLIDIKNSIAKEIKNNITMNIYYGVIDKFISVRPNEPISFFIKHIYSNDIYRNSIIDGNEIFFSENNFSSLIKEDEKKLKSMFMFKECWVELSLERREFIKNAMKTLVDITKKYIEEKYNGNQLLGKYV